MMHNKQPYSFEKTDVRGRFLLNFSCTKVQSKNVSPIAGNKCMRACFNLQHYTDKARLDVILNWHFTNYQTDPDNIFFGVKFILDGLVNSGKLKNDGCANVRNIFHQYSISNRKGVTVTLIEL